MKAQVFARAQKTDQFYEEQKRLRIKMDAKIEREKTELWQKFKESQSKDEFKIWIQKHLS